MTKLANPVPIFLDARGVLLDGGMIYVGQANADPQVFPVTVFWNSDLTGEAQQPLRTLGGTIVNGTNSSNVFLAEQDYSMRVLDNTGSLVFYQPSIYLQAQSFQPLDSDLTAIANQGTTSYGRSLLALADQNALKTATGLPTPLPAAGGTVTGNILRQGAGVHAYWADPAMTGGRIFITASGAGDPTSQPGDIWVTY